MVRAFHVEDIEVGPGRLPHGVAKDMVLVQGWAWGACDSVASFDRFRVGLHAGMGELNAALMCAAPGRLSQESRCCSER